MAANNRFTPIVTYTAQDRLRILNYLNEKRQANIDAKAAEAIAKRNDRLFITPRYTATLVINEEIIDTDNIINNANDDLILTQTCNKINRGRGTIRANELGYQRLVRIMWILREKARLGLVANFAVYVVANNSKILEKASCLNEEGHQYRRVNFATVGRRSILKIAAHVQNEKLNYELLTNYNNFEIADTILFNCSFKRTEGVKISGIVTVSNPINHHEVKQYLRSSKVDISGKKRLTGKIRRVRGR